MYCNSEECKKLGNFFCLKPFSLWQQNACSCTASPSALPLVADLHTKGSSCKDATFLPPLLKFASSAGQELWLRSRNAALGIPRSAPCPALGSNNQGGFMCWAGCKRISTVTGEHGRTAGIPCSWAEDTMRCQAQKATSWG